MAMEIRDEDNVLVIHIPNSEACVDAQHNGGKDTSVGSYYMSEMQPAVFAFLNDLEGDYYIDLSLCLFNGKKIYNELKNRGLQNAFKRKLMPQNEAIQFIEWCIENESPLFRMPNPTVNDNNKYLKFDNLNQTVNAFRQLCLGELTDIIIKKIGENGYIIYLDKCDQYYKKIDDTIYKWVINND